MYNDSAQDCIAQKDFKTISPCFFHLIFLTDVTHYWALAGPSFVSEALPFTYIISTGGPRIVQILGHQGIVLLQKSY